MSFLSSLKQKFNCHIRNKHLILKITRGNTEEGQCIFCGKTVYKIINFQNIKTHSLNNIRDKTGGEK